MPMFGPFVAPLVGAGVSALGGLFGGNKQKQNQNQTQTSNSTFNQTQSQQGQSEQQRKFNENPMFMAGREQLMQVLANEFGRAQQPVYGAAQTTKFMSDLNDLTGAATSRLKTQLAGSGGLNNGRFAGGVADFERDRAGKAVDFLSQIPAMNEQARSDKTNNLMNLAAQWLGTGPVDESVTGSTNMTSTTNGTENRTTTGNMNQTGDNGQGGWRGALGGLAGFGGGLLGDVVAGNGSRWGIGSRPKGNQGWNQYDPLA